MTHRSSLHPIAIPHPAESVILSKVPESVQQRAQAIKMVVFDVDGVLTDGGLYYGDQGEVVKRFHALDGHGLKMLMHSGITVAILTGRQSDITTRRMAELGISLMQQQVRDKGEAVVALAKAHQLRMDQLAFVGDDVIDIPAMQKVGLALSVPNAPIYVQQTAHWVGLIPGGAGAAREHCDMILASQRLLGKFLSPEQPGRAVQPIDGDVIQ